MRPKIGITTSFKEIEGSLGEQRLRREYVDAVARSGGLPLIMPMMQDTEAINDLADSLDGLIMTGGPSIKQGLQGDLPDDLSRNTGVRLNADTLLFKKVLEKRKPFLGICYGMQQLNAFFGGTIYADVERADGFMDDHLSTANSGANWSTTDSRLTHSQKRGAATHNVSLLRGTHLHQIMQQDELEVNTRHLQAVAAVGEGLRVSAVAPDGVIEGIEDESGQLLGVQFHPERDLDQFLPLFRHFAQLSAQQPQSVVPEPTAPHPDPTH